MENEDLLDRGSFANRLVSVLIDKDSGRSTGHVVALVGPWGSGKTFVVDLVKKSLSEFGAENPLILLKHEPWLVTGQDDLIRRFFIELASSIQKDGRFKRVGKKLVKSLHNYANALGSAADIYVPGFGKILSALVRLFTWPWEREKSIYEQKSKVEKLIAEIDAPIVIILDELDRIDDEEVRKVVQLVRAIADFPSVSYLLAFDINHAARAVGNNDEKKGRAFLEKLVSIQIPLPSVSKSERLRFLEDSFDELASKERLSIDWRQDARFLELAGFVFDDYLKSPRDLVRVRETFLAYHRIVADEVYWVDILAYSVLAVVSPHVVQRLSFIGEAVCEDPIEVSAFSNRFGLSRDTPEVVLERYFPDIPDILKYKRVLSFLFPVFSEETPARDRDGDYLCYRRPFLTLLRLDLVKDAIPRREMLKIIRAVKEKRVAYISDAISDDKAASFVDRLQIMARETGEVLEADFWLDCSKALQVLNLIPLHKPDMRHSIFRGLSGCILTLLASDSLNPIDRRSLVSELLTHSLNAFGPIVLRDHFQNYGLFNWSPRTNRFSLLKEAEVISAAEELSHALIANHLNSDWLLHQVDLSGILVIRDVGKWDAVCRTRAQDLLDTNEKVLRFVLLFYGAGYMVDQSTFEAIVDPEWFKSVAFQVLKSRNLYDPLNVIAVEKALGLVDSYN